MAIETVKVPDLGGADGVEVIEITVSPGDEIAEEDTLLVLESDKASMDVPSPMAGTVKKILVKLGDTISEGTPIVEMESASASESASNAPAETADEEAQPEPEANQQSQEAQTESAKEDSAADASDAATEQPLTLPDLGTSDEVDVIELTVAVGDEVAEGDTLMTLEGDKATMDVPSPALGKIANLTVKEGDKVTSGHQIGIIVTAASNSKSAQKSSTEQVPNADKSAEKASKKANENVAENASEQTASEKTSAEKNSPHKSAEKQSSGAQESSELNEPEAPAAEVYAGPVVRQFARELGIDLRNVKGSGVKDRIQKSDVKSYVKKALIQMVQGGQVADSAAGAIPPIPDLDFAKFGEIEEIPLSKIAKLTATNMRRTWLNVPAVTQFDDADITELEAFRKSLKADAERRGVKITPLPFLMKACASVLRENPVINRSWHSSGEKIIQKHYVHIGMAVATPNGLLVPVIRDVDKKGIFEIAEDIGVLSEKARTGKLSPTEMQGGCFSISSLGSIGGRGFTPIVNAPEAAILGVSKSTIQPVWNGEAFEPKLMLPLSLSYDHKLVNGADAGKFLTALVVMLGDMRRLLL